MFPKEKPDRDCRKEIGWGHSESIWKLVKVVRKNFLNEMGTERGGGHCWGGEILELARQEAEGQSTKGDRTRYRIHHKQELF